MNKEEPRRKLLKSDYTDLELRTFPDAPFWDEDESPKGL